MKRPLVLLCAPLCAVALAACASTVTTSAFKGTQQEVAKTVANLQADATASEQKKICANDLAAEVVTRLGGSKGCEAALKSQLAELDNMEVSVKSIEVASGGSTATAHVTSIVQGKSTRGTIALVKQAGKWKVSGL